ncbi:MAG: hypothetical protein ABIJ21_05590 [Nanoarchaeota archaeon]
MKEKIMILVLAIAILVFPTFAFGAVGDIVHQLDVSTFDYPGYTNFCSIGLAFDGAFLYYNRCNDQNIYIVDPISGELMGMKETGIDFPNAMAYDASRNGIWFGSQQCTVEGMPIYFWDIDSDVISLAFIVPLSLHDPDTGYSFFSYCFLDGLAFNANGEGVEDDEIWFSDDIMRMIALFRPDGTFIDGFDASETHPELFYLSGLAIGGQNLYMGNNGGGKVFRADKDSMVYIDQFVSEDERLEDMECDPVTFSPTEVMWVRHTPQGSAADDLITAFEIEPGTCGIGGHDIPEFGLAGILAAVTLAGIGVFLIRKRK